MTDWAQKVADWSFPILVSGIVAVAKWVHSVSIMVQEHDKAIEEGERQHDECARRGMETAERLTAAETNHEHFHETIQEVKQDLKEILRTLRGRNGV